MTTISVLCRSIIFLCALAFADKRTFLPIFGNDQVAAIREQLLRAQPVVQSQWSLLQQTQPVAEQHFGAVAPDSVQWQTRPQHADVPIIRTLEQQRQPLQSLQQQQQQQQQQHLQPLQQQQDDLQSISPYDCRPQDEVAIGRCAHPLYDIGAFTEGASQQTFSWQLFNEEGGKYLSTLCKAYLRFDLCIDPYKEYCFTKEPIKSRYESVMNVLEFMCKEGYKEMTSSFDCLVGAISRGTIAQCQSAMLSASGRMAFEAGSSQLMDTSVGRRANSFMAEMNEENFACNVMREYLACVRPAIMYECGPDAYGLVQQVIARPTQLVMPYCALSGSSVTPSMMVITFSMILSTMFLR